MDTLRRLRVALGALLLLGAAACSRPGINAGEQGGRAFIALAGLLILTVVVLAIFLGHED